MSKPKIEDRPPLEYVAAIADLEERATRGELTIAQVRQEIFALRERFCAGPAVMLQWATQAHAARQDRQCS